MTLQVVFLCFSQICFSSYLKRSIVWHLQGNLSLWLTLYQPPPLLSLESFVMSQVIGSLLDRSPRQVTRSKLHKLQAAR